MAKKLLIVLALALAAAFPARAQYVLFGNAPTTTPWSRIRPSRL